MDIELSLQDAGHEVAPAPNADRALHILRARAFDLILTDIDMPGSMDGLALAGAVRDRWPPMKIVVMSGKRRPAEHEMPGEARFIPKPFTQTVLLAAVGSW